MRWWASLALVVAACGAEPPKGDAGSRSTPPGTPTTGASSETTSPTDVTPPTDTGTPCGTVLRYETWGRGFMTSWCTGCHHSALTGDDREGAPLGVDLETHDGVLLWAELILVRAAGELPTMPPVGGADAIERERLREWLECGAP